MKMFGRRISSALLLTSVLWPGLWLMSGQAMAAGIIVDDGSNNFRPLASNVPAYGNVWNSLAQSFTAKYSRIIFGFRWLDSDPSLPHAGASIIYRLYNGENSYSTLLASRTVRLPNTGTSDPRPCDVGYAYADFRSVSLVVGRKYTVEITVPPTALPVQGTDTGFGVWTSGNNPYGGGRFFFPSGYNNSYFSQDDMLFRISTDPIPLGDYGYPVVPYLPGSYALRTFFKNQDHLGEDEKLAVRTPVRSIGQGKIVRYGPAGGYGELVAVVEHDLGRAFTFKNAYGDSRSTRYILSIYGHIRKSEARGGKSTGLAVGDTVARGTILGYINNSSHPDGLAVDPNGDGLEHLHFGIRLSSAATAKLRDPTGWYRGYERRSSFGADFAAGSDVIPILRGQ